MMKLSDFVFEYLKSVGVNTVFTLAGGGIMHLIDSLGHSGMEYVCCHHEQSCSIAAQAYDMYREQLSVCLVTTGPGGTNALTGVAASYVDSTPVIYMSGQVKRSDFASLRGVRQFGAQENDILSMVKPVTKYAVLVEREEDILYELQKCVHYATTGRKGPVWIDIPLDVQAAVIDESALRQYRPEENTAAAGSYGTGSFGTGGRAADIERAAADTLSLLRRAQRPLLLVGQGMVSAGAAAETERLARKLRLPVLATWRALDFMDSDDELFFGSPGLQAPRYSNLILQHCDALLVLGSRLDNMLTAFGEEHFAFRAKKVIVDIDGNEIRKLHMPDVVPVIADVKDFVTALLRAAKNAPGEVRQSEKTTEEGAPQGSERAAEHSACAGAGAGSCWLERCRAVRRQFPIEKEIQDKADKVDLYRVTEAISAHCTPEDTIVISSTSRCNTAGHIAFRHKKGQKTISSMGMGSMGFALPSAVGAYYACGKKRVVVIEGDGSLQLNIQELETISAARMDVKLFIFNNSGYAAITTMQDRNFDSFYVGSNEKSGLFMPDLEKIAYAYGIPYVIIETDCDIREQTARVMNMEGPALCDVKGSLWFDEIPKCISSVDETGRRVSAALENPYPFLAEEEMLRITEYLLSGNLRSECAAADGMAVRTKEELGE